MRASKVEVGFGVEQHVTASEWQRHSDGGGDRGETQARSAQRTGVTLSNGFGGEKEVLSHCEGWKDWIKLCKLA